MTPIEFKKEREAMLKRHQEELKSLSIQYAVSNAIYKVGDILKGERTIIRVTKIKVAIYNGVPEAVYYGNQLKKDLTAKKDSRIIPIFEGLVERKLDEPKKK